MPEKKSKNGQRYKINGRVLIWTTDGTWDDPTEIQLPLRIKLRVLRELNDRELDADTMATMLEAVAPAEAAKFPEMDANDFTEMFLTWRREYENLSGATLGE